MANLSTYNKLHNYLKQFADNHQGVRRFKLSFLEQLDNFSTEEQSFPILYISPDGVDLDENINSFNYRVYCLDLLQKDRSNEADILNDTLLVLRDFVIWLKQEETNTLNLLNTPTAIPVNNYLMDFTAGWYIDVNIEADANWTDCSIPFSEAFTLTGITCDTNYVSSFLTCSTLDQCDTIIALQEAISNIATSQETITVGEDVNINDLVYLSTDGTYRLASNNDEEYSSTELRIVLSATTSGLTTTGLITGKVTTTGLTQGDKYWVGTNYGTYSNIQPTANGSVIRYIGTALDTNTLIFNPDQTYMEIGDDDLTGYTANNFIFVSQKSDFPAPSSGVITLLDNATYFITDVVDLEGDRLVAGENTTIIGGSSENCRIKSTGLVGTALITSQYSLPIRNITIEADIALDLDGDGITSAIDWFGVNFTDCNSVGRIANYSNFIMQDSAFLNAGNLTFDGVIGTIGFTQCLFNNNSGSTAFILADTLTITRRFRIIYSSFVTLAGETSLLVNPNTVIPTESFILDTVNFAGGGTYLSGIDVSNNKTLFVNCVNIQNTSVNGQLYMQENTTPTTISNITDFYKVSGTTSGSTDNEKYIASNNRLTCDAVIERKYLIQATLSFTSGNNNVCQFGFYDSKLGGIRNPSKTLVTANAGGRAENIHLMCVVNHSQGDYIEVWARNTSSTTSITVDNLNMTITQIN